MLIHRICHLCHTDEEGNNARSEGWQGEFAPADDRLTSLETNGRQGLMQEASQGKPAGQANPFRCRDTARQATGRYEPLSLNMTRYQSMPAGLTSLFGTEGNRKMGIWRIYSENFRLQQGCGGRLFSGAPTQSRTRQ